MLLIPIFELLSQRRSKLTKHSRKSFEFPDAPQSFRLCSYAMSESVSTPAIKSAGSFASLLESFTGPAKKADGMWDDSAMLDDVATISYEQALRSHRRVAPVAALCEDEPQSTVPHIIPQALPAAPGKKRKTASITIRLTEAEEAQLQERAAAAQLTVSAYLRSCIFEAESLRAQVKEALLQMKVTAALSPHVSEEPQSKARSGWRARLIPRWSQPHNSA